MVKRGGLDSGLGTFSHVEYAGTQQWDRKKWEARQQKRQQRRELMAQAVQEKIRMTAQAFCTVCGEIFPIPDDLPTAIRGNVRRCSDCTAKNKHAQGTAFCRQCGTPFAACNTRALCDSCRPQRKQRQESIRQEALSRARISLEAEES